MERAGRDVVVEWTFGRRVDIARRVRVMFDHVGDRRSRHPSLDCNDDYEIFREG